MYKICRLPYKFDIKIQKQMEIRNALQKIENYLTVVSNLNKTILSEGTMSRDELLLMKKYLYTSIDRIEDIERSLIIGNVEEDSFVPSTKTESVFIPTKEKEIVEVEATQHTEQIEAALNNDFSSIEQPKAAEIIAEKTEIANEANAPLEMEMPIAKPSDVTEEKNENAIENPVVIESIITEDYTLNQAVEYNTEEVKEVQHTKVEPIAPTKTFAESIITEDYSLNNRFVDNVNMPIATLVNETNEVTPMFTEKQAEAPINSSTEDNTLNKIETAPVSAKEEAVKLETPVATTIPEPFLNKLEEHKPVSLAESLAQKESLSLADIFGQQQHTLAQQQLFESFDDGKDELHETFSSNNAFEPVVTLESEQQHVVSSVFESHETVLVAEQKETKVVVDELTPSSLNEIFKPKVNTESLNSKMGKTLSESIALNDKFIFVRELFGNQFSEYENGLKQLEILNSFEQAESYCNEKFRTKFNWNDRTSSVERFMTVLQKRFN